MRSLTLALGRGFVVAVCLLVVFAGCAEHLATSHYSADPSRAGQPPSAVAESDSPNWTSRPVLQDPDVLVRQMVYHGQFEVVVANVDEAVTALERRVAELSGYIEARQNGHLRCRVPAANFQTLVATLPSLGQLTNQAIENQDVTDQYRDLELRLQTAESSRQRILALLDRAGDLDAVIKLEEQLRKLTAEIETMKGQLKRLSSQVAYSTVEVDFKPAAPASEYELVSSRSPFGWINEVGAEILLNQFDNEPAEQTPLSAVTRLGGRKWSDVPEGFLVLEESRDALKAISSDESKLWLRELRVANHVGASGDLSFWTEALKNHLVRRRGYRLVGDEKVTGNDDQAGRELVFEVTSSGTVYRYLVTLFVDEPLFWTQRGTVRIAEFLATRQPFDQHVARVRDATTVR